MRKYLVIFSLLLTVSSHAIHSVGNGGGLGEMKAGYVYRNMERFLKICLSSQAVCNLTAAQKSLVQKVLGNMKSEYSNGGIDFFDDPNRENAIETSRAVGSVVKINSYQLYSDEGIVESFQHIGTVIMTALLLHNSTDATAALSKTASRAFGNLYENTQSQPIYLSGQKTILHHMLISNSAGQTVQEILAIEQDKITTDLEAFIAHATQCAPTDLSWSTKNLRWLSGAHTNQKYVTGDLKWSCTNPQTQAKGVLKLDLSFSSSGVLDISTSSSAILGVIRY